MRLKVGDYYTDSLAHAHISPIYMAVAINEQGRVYGYAVFDYRCNPPLPFWGARKSHGPVAGAHPVPEMLILARASSGEEMCSPPEGWKLPEDEIW